MTISFSASIRLAPQGGAGDPEIVTAAGNSQATSRDGRTIAIVLGSTKHAASARQIADSYRGAEHNLATMDVPGSGVLLVERDRGTCLVVMPRIGIRNVFWKSTSDELKIASTPAALTAGSLATAEINPAAIYEYLYFHMLPAPSSIYRGVSKLCGGHYLRWQSGRASVERYWHPAFGRNAPRSESEAAEELRATLRGAVERSAKGGSAIGAFLSGGLDSSTVAGYAAELLPAIPTITMGFDAAGYDEMEYARIASRRFRTKPLEYYVTPEDVLRTLPNIAAAFPEPFGNSSAAAVFHCARIARENGLDLLLAGDGGDELFGGNERYAKQMVFERYGRIPKAFRRCLLEPAVAAATTVTTAYPFGKARSYIEQANIPLPDRLQHYNFLHRHSPDEVFAASMLEQLDASGPLRQLRDEYAVPDADSAIDRMLFMDWKFTLHDNDLVKVNSMCELAGIDVAYPMLDPAVVAFSLRLPADWKVRGSELRWFYKRAMQGFLPDAILQKTKHGFGLPFGVWMRTHEGLRRLADDCLQSLAARGYFREQFIRDALRMHQESHAAFYGELVWILTVLELWIREHSTHATA